MEAFSWLMIVVRGPRPLWAGPTPVQEALGVVGKQDKNTLRSHAISGVLSTVSASVPVSEFLA